MKGKSTALSLGVLMCFLVISNTSYAGGFSLFEQGAKATAVGGAFVARADDPSAMFYNVAGMGFLSGTQIYLGATAIKPFGSFTGTIGSPGPGVEAEQEDQIFLPPNVYATYNFHPNWTAGLGVYVPFALGTKWANDFEGRAFGKEANIEGIYISPAIAYKASDQFSIGAGFEFVYTQVQLIRYSQSAFYNGEFTAVYDVARVEIDGTSTGFGFNVGAMYKINDQWSAGVSYRHQVENKYDNGEATFKDLTGSITDPVVQAAAAAQLAAIGKRVDGETAITFPGNLAVGLAYKLNEQWQFSSDFNYVMWDVFDKVELDFENDILDTELREDYKNTWQLRLGAEYAATDQLDLRAGYIYDKTPSPTGAISPTLPDASRNDYAIGFGYAFSPKFYVDFSYLWVNFQETNTKGKNFEGFEGKYKTDAHLFSLNFGFNLGGAE